MPSPEFFQVMPVSDALRQLEAQWRPAPQAETIATADALYRILAADIASPEQVPAFRKSTVDGYALRAADTFGASQSLPAFLTVGGELAMGEAPALDVGAGEALLIHTGGMLPASADAVVMIEHTQASGADEIEALRAVAPGENVIQAGEDIGAGERILPDRQRLRAQDIGGLLAVGIASVEVLRRPRIGILSCGDELLPPEAGAPPPHGKVRDINAYTLSALAQKLGAAPMRLGIASDDFADYQRRAREGFAACDILLAQRRQFGLGARLHPRCHRRPRPAGHPAARLGCQTGQADHPGPLRQQARHRAAGQSGLGAAGGAPAVARSGRAITAGSSLEAPRLVSARLSQRVASVTGREDWLALRLREDKRGLASGAGLRQIKPDLYLGRGGCPAACPAEYRRLRCRQPGQCRTDLKA